MRRKQRQQTLRAGVRATTLLLLIGSQLPACTQATSGVGDSAHAPDGVKQEGAQASPWLSTATVKVHDAQHAVGEASVEVRDSHDGTSRGRQHRLEQDRQLELGPLFAADEVDHPRPHPPQLPGDLTDHLLVIPEHKLLFCFIAKNNCLSFNDLFRSLRERYDPSLAEGPNFGRNSYINHNMTLEQLTEYVYDPTWHKAVFYREPLVRFVSAFRSKCERGHHTNKMVCLHEFGQKYPRFTEVVERLAQGPPVSNPHWRPQVDFCGGLSGILSEFQTIEALDARTSREKVAEVLKKVGIEDPESIPAFNERFPPPDPETGVWHPEGSHFWHSTNAEDAVMQYYTPYLACTVFQYYLDDYLLFGIPAPAWTRKWDFHVQQWARVDCSTLKEDP